MAKIQGEDIISGQTSKSVNRLILVSTIVIFIKLYRVDLADLSLLGLSLPPELFDIVALALIVWGTYVLFLSWLTDLVSFRKWYNSRNLWMEFSIDTAVDKKFYGEGAELLLKLFRLEHDNSWPSRIDDMDDELKEKYTDFKTNVELFIVRLEAAGSNFKQVSRFGKYYIWIQSFAIPLLLAISATLLLLSDGQFMPPTKSELGLCVETLNSSVKALLHCKSYGLTATRLP